MKKTRKTTLFVLLLSLVCLLAACLCACSDGANGADGKDGVNGKSAYEIWLDEGYTGSQADFLNWLKGKDGSDGSGGSGSDGKDGQDGKDGKSAYQIWLDNGHTGTETDFLEWLKGEDGKDGTNGSNGQDGQNGSDGTDGSDGKSAYQIFKEQYPYYQGTEEQWLIALVNGGLHIHTLTFQSEVVDDITKYVLDGYAFTDIPEVPEKEGQTSAKWNVTDFSNITTDITITAEYDMRKYVTFHNEYTEDEDIKITVNYGEAITDIPTITEKVGNSSKWSVPDFSRITEDMQVNAVYETQGLQYTLINQQTQYRVSKGEMNTQTSELFIPAEYDGKAVTVIDTNAFSDCGFESAHIPDSIAEIRDSAFSGCSSLTSVTIPDGVTSIGDYAFSECGSLTSVTIPDSVTSIGGGAFYYCSSLTSVTIPDSVTSINYNAFYYCSSLTSVTIPNSVTSIESSVFSGCSSLTSITIPNSVTSIWSNAFNNCSKLETIYYISTQTEFNNMSVASSGNTSFTDAMVYFYSETQPTTDGYYWHYDTDGKTPVLWVKEN